VVEKKQQRYQYEAICSNHGCDVKGVMQDYKSNVSQETIKCVSCGNEIPLTLVKINLLMYQDGVED
jgi:hypothetical protein